MRGRAVPAAMAAGSVVLGCVVGALVNILTERWDATVACALITAVGGWASLEAWRVLRQPDDAAGIHVNQRVRQVFGRLVGVRGAKAREVHVRSEVDTVWPRGEVIGLEDGPKSKAVSDDD